MRPARLLRFIAVSAAFVCIPAAAHGTRAGAIEITHPFATPSVPGARNGAAYLVRIENSGSQPDRLLKAETPVAQRAELHTMAVDAGGIMRMREVDAIPLPPKSSVEMRPGTGYHVMLMELKAPLKDGDSFPLTLWFEGAGKVDVKVVVQTPKADGGHPH